MTQGSLSGSPRSPLSGCGVLVTRPAAQAPALAADIEAAGGQALLFPVLVIEPVPLATEPPDADWYIFISPNAVKHGWPLVAAQAAKAQRAAVGPGTAQALTDLGYPAHVHPTTGNSENLLNESALQTMAEQRVVIVRGDGGRDLLADTLKQRGAQVSYLEVYRRALSSESTAELNAAWREGRLQAVSLMSTGTLEGLYHLLDEQGRKYLANSQLVGTSPRMLKLSRDLGLPLPLLTDGVDNKAMVAALGAWWQSRQKAQASSQ